MIIILQILLLLAGFVGLIKGADFFVDGSASLARNFKVPGLIVGLTIVSLGTSCPELAVSTSAALQGSNEIALSNVIGSNIFNTLVVLGVCALFHPIPVDVKVLRRDFPVCIGATVFVFLMAAGAALFGGRLSGLSMADEAGTVSRIAGVILLIAMVAYISYLVIDARKHPEKEEDEKKTPIWKCFLFIVIGIAMIVGGGEAVVYSAKEIARAAGMTETLIGLTIIAVGTSLPELVTSVVAARKGQVEMAVGNAIGSNILNICLILGVSSVINPVAVNAASVYDMIILLGITVLTMIFSATGRKINRIEGLIMVLAYAGDVVFAALR
ncbi:MAG: calcium/sodium antiporter [Lachnospiraceae bacterium]|nr:calcium/sodium antiporter [Lachnospiraceae bacterium]